MMIYFGAKLKRFKIWLYPLMFVINPFFNWYYMVYGIFTAGQRTWGGPRADAGAADSSTSPQQVIEKAAAEGDDFLLEFRREVAEVIAVAGHAHDQIPVLFRAGLSLAQRVRPHDVELEVVAVQFEVGPHQVRPMIDTGFLGDEGRGELHV